jgi:hypothetical protein
MSTVFQQNTDGTPSNTFGNRKKGFARVKVAALRAFIAEHPAATVRQAMDACGLSSTSETHRLLKEARADLVCCPTCGGRGSIRQESTTAPIGADGGR